MIPKQDLLDACRHETTVVQHLASHLRPEHMEWRPTPQQRSFLELLRYMTVMASIPAVKCVTGNWDHAEEMSAATGAVTLESFAAAMDAQMAHVEQVLGDIDEAVAKDTPAAMPWGEATPLSACILRTVYAPFPAYRMQLFLYLKQSGAASDISTRDNWAGPMPS